MGRDAPASPLGGPGGDEPARREPGPARGAGPWRAPAAQATRTPAQHATRSPPGIEETQAGNKLAPASIGLPAEIPQDVRNLVTFKVLGEHRTELTVTEYGYVSDQILELSKAGLEQVLDKLATSLQ